MFGCAQSCSRVNLQRRFWCIKGSIVVFGGVYPEPAVTQPLERDAIYRRRGFPREVIEGCVRWYLTYPPEPSRSRRPHGRMGRARQPHVDHALGLSVRAGVRATVEPPGEACWLVVAYGRDVHTDPTQDGFPLSRSRQARKDRRVVVPDPARNRCGDGLFPQGGDNLCAPMAAQYYPGWPRT